MRRNVISTSILLMRIYSDIENVITPNSRGSVDVARYHVDAVVRLLEVDMTFVDCWDSFQHQRFICIAQSGAWLYSHTNKLTSSHVQWRLWLTKWSKTQVTRHWSLYLIDKTIQYKELVEPGWWLVASSPFPNSFCKIILLLLRKNCQILDHLPQKQFWQDRDSDWLCNEESKHLWVWGE